MREVYYKHEVIRRMYLIHRPTAKFSKIVWYEIAGAQVDLDVLGINIYQKDPTRHFLKINRVIRIKANKQSKLELRKTISNQYNMHSILLNMFIIKKTCHFNLGNVLDICQGSQI